MGFLDAPHSIGPMGFFVRVFPSLLTSEVVFRKAFPRGLLRKEIEVMNSCVLRRGGVVVGYEESKSPFI